MRKKSFSYVWRVVTLAILASPLTALSPAEAVPAGVPNQPCGTLSNPRPGTLCYTVTPGGGKASAGGSSQEFSTIIQATEPEYVIASVVVEVTSAAGERNGPTVSQISPGGTASIVTVATNKLRELTQIKGELQAKATVLSGPALIEAQAKLSALSEQVRTFEEVVTKTTAAGQDAGKFQVTGSARPRRCGTFNADKCGSWIEYNIYVVRRYVGNPIAAYNRAFAVAEDAKNTINRLIASQSTPSQQPSQPSNSACVTVDSRNGWQHFNLPGSFTRVASISGGWSVDARNYSPVRSGGHTGQDAERLAPYNQYKFDQRFPFGALLMGTGGGTLWVQNPVSFTSGFGAVDMRINDADNALGDNGGTLQVCFGN
ncbi:hypothetical protein [Floridanema evergladense]|uniref:hypothetical protein n=1 Tax=Floridanema evergladense TaxID=3396172 RepID=UPI0039A5DF9F